QHAQLAAAGKLASDLLEDFRKLSNNLISLSLSTLQHEIIAPGAPIQRTDEYLLAKAARAEYDEALMRIREILPGFLAKENPLLQARQTLDRGECLAYISNTPEGSVAILLSGLDANGPPQVQAWWDECLTTDTLRSLITAQTSKNVRSQERWATQSEAN